MRSRCESIESSSIEQALSAWRAVLPADGVLTGPGLQKYRENCLGIERSVPAVLLPRSEAQVVSLVNIAAAKKVPLYSISTGNNWGYGTAAPVLNNCVIVDLSRMNRIIEMDPELGLVTLEPGVNQQQLFEFLATNDLDFFVPTTGAGPLGSLVGNALERGFGITPAEDHFRAVTSIRAVLADGRVYRSAMAESGAPAGGVWRWGIGPYLDGLFSQGNLGIVTALQLALVRRPEHVEVYLFTQRDPARLPQMFEAARRTLIELRGLVGAVKYINQKQVEMTVGTDGIGVSVRPNFAWMGFGVFHCRRSMVAPIRREIRRLLRPHVSQLVFMNDARLAVLDKLYKLVPGKGGRVLQGQAARIRELLQIVNGVPRALELKLAYRHVRTAEDGAPRNPIRDGVGLLWYAPVIPLKSDVVLQMVRMVEETLREFHFEQALSITTIDENCSIGVIPIIYKRPDDRERAHACFRQLWKRGALLGCYPYRINVAVMPEMTDPDRSVFWDVAGKVKAAVDPDGILSPGRYTPANVSQSNHENPADDE